MQVSHRLAAESVAFDEDNLVSCAGLVPVMTLAAQTRLLGLLDEKVQIVAPRIKSGAANPAPKLATVVAGMVVGADCINDIDVLRSGGMKALFDGVYAPSTVGTLLREFTFGHARQLESVLREHLVALCGREPTLKRRLSALASERGVAFADIAIMTSVPGQGLATPLLASGEGARRAAMLLGAYGACVEVLDEPAGAASQRKLLRSVFYKGMAAAVVEALAAARTLGLEEWLWDNIAQELASSSEQSLHQIVFRDVPPCCAQSRRDGCCSDDAGRLGCRT